MDIGLPRDLMSPWQGWVCPRKSWQGLVQGAGQCSWGVSPPSLLSFLEQPLLTLLLWTGEKGATPGLGIFDFMGGVKEGAGSLSFFSLAPEELLSTKQQPEGIQ